MRIEYVRDGLVEEFHEGIFLEYTESKPDSGAYPYYLRSCAKPLQAALLIDYNADLSDEELALCCGSHSGEECHLEAARRIMKKYGLREEMLKCGIHAPLSRTMQDKMLLRGEKPTPLHNNCSGKHLGFLVLCKINGWNLENYYELNHPLQQAVIKKIYEMCGIDVDANALTIPAEEKMCVNSEQTLASCANKMPDSVNAENPGHSITQSLNHYPITTDGCGVPIVSMPLYNMLIGYINLLKYTRICDAIMKYPYIFGGENRLDTEIIQKTENLVAKVGAGGLCIVLNTKKNDAFVVKINDCSMEARRFAVLDTINRLGWGNIEFDDKIKTLSGKVVGRIIVDLYRSLHPKS